MEIVFLGTTGPIPTERRNLSGVILDYLNEYFLFDCGEGTQRQMRIASINFMRIDKVFITHLHADHFLGLGGLIQSMDFLERKRPLNIYGPAGLENTINHMLSMGTFKLDSLELNTYEINEGIVLKGKNYTVSCTHTDHTPNSLAYCFEEDPKRKFLKKKALELGVPEGRMFSKLQDGEPVIVRGKKITPEDVLSDPIPGRKVVYTGDTRICDNVIKISKNADILIHDGTFSQEEIDNVKKAGHSTAKQAAEVAKRANVRKLYLTHISQRYTDANVLQKEAREIFPESYAAEDFMRVKVERH